MKLSIPMSLPARSDRLDNSGIAEASKIPLRRQPNFAGAVPGMTLRGMGSRRAYEKAQHASS
jgi:hypothetical protein